MGAKHETRAAFTQPGGCDIESQRDNLARGVRKRPLIAESTTIERAQPSLTLQRVRAGVRDPWSAELVQVVLRIAPRLGRSPSEADGSLEGKTTVGP